MNIYLTRHAQTRENELGLLQGQTGVTFTFSGLKSLPRLTEAINSLELDVCYSSDLPRCVETSRIVLGDRFKRIKYSKLLREKNNGQMVGKKANEINWDNLPGTFETRKLPGGESLVQVRDRAKKFLKLLSEDKSSRDILVIGHGAFLKILLGLILGLNLRQSIFDLNVDHCSLTTVRLEGNLYEVIRLNDTTHLNLQLRRTGSC